VELASLVPDATFRLDLRLSAAIAAGKIARLASRRFGFGGGTALPGAVAGWIDSGALGKLARALPRGSVLITGTNGKTTTSRLLAAFLAADGRKVIHNRAGANLRSGLLTALVGSTNLLGRSPFDSALFEVDEAVMPSIVSATSPRMIVLTNLFRDQLDRYGEVDYVASVWRDAVADLPSSVALILNADDPAVAALGRLTKAKVVYFGIDAPGDATRVGHVADTKNCPFCGQALKYSVVRYAHVGSYWCPSGDFERPPASISARSIVTAGVEATELEVAGSFGTRSWRFKLPGLYNVYNLLAAVAAALEVGVSIDRIGGVLEDFSGAFGRLERIAVGDRSLFFALIKNPVGFSEVLRTILDEPGDRDLAIFINDNLADGTDVSWLWDADVEPLACRIRSVVVGGTRRADMAVRLKYAGAPAERIRIADSVTGGLDLGLSMVLPGGTLYVLPTYTAMLELRTLAGSRGYASRYWEE
jgi:UDP-N-acetylmuramyl tripeptide synthase